jgi:two-component system NtrC family sensor kinase
VDIRAAALTRLFDSVHHGIYIGPVGRDRAATIAANPSLKQMLGFPLDAPDSGVNPFDVDRFADQRARETFLAKLLTEGVVNDYPLHVRRNDGSVLLVEVTASVQAGASMATPGRQGFAVTTPAAALRRVSDSESDRPAPLVVGALIRDITARTRREDPAVNADSPALQAEKMAALGQTISGVAHELNNPLATILSWAERLNEQSADDKTRRGLDVILGEAERAARIVRNLLTFARKRQTTRMMVDINDVVLETLAVRADDQRQSNIEVSRMIAPRLPNVFADAHQIKQVFLNLLTNAEQAMLAAHGRGTLTIRTSHDSVRHAVLLEVTDDGPGIEEEVQAKVFDPFFTTKQVGKGTGLGLSVAYAIVQEHGGHIALTSRPGAGASFVVELPVAGQSLQQPRATVPAPVSFEALNGLKVLVVEDEPALAVAVSEALADAGCLVNYARDGEEGLNLLADGAYDLIVCDLKMPRTDGMQFYRAMATVTPGLARRVIFVTGAVAGTEAETFLEETGCRWLAKPFRLGDLLRAARDAVA